MSGLRGVLESRGAVEDVSVKRALIKLIEALSDELVPIVWKVVSELLAGRSVDAVLTQAERDAIARGMQLSFDEALNRTRGVQ